MVYDHHDGLRPLVASATEYLIGATGVGVWSVERDGSVFAISAEPGSGTVTYTIDDRRFVTDVATAQEIRQLEFAAIATAQGEQQP